MARQLIYEVTAVQAQLDGNILSVQAQGTTRTGGWTDPELVPVYGRPDLYEFMATPPSGPATDAITPIEVKYTSGPLLPPFPNLITVKAETNHKQVPV